MLSLSPPAYALGVVRREDHGNINRQLGIGLMYEAVPGYGISLVPSMYFICSKGHSSLGSDKSGRPVGGVQAAGRKYLK